MGIATGAGALIGGLIGGGRGAGIGALAGAGGGALYTYKIKPKQRRYYNYR
jgi:membrane associated rhomboid family serine protease